MIVSPFFRLLLLVIAGIVPRWQAFFTTSTDYSVRGLCMPIIDSLGLACVIIIARTRNPQVDGQPVEVVAPPGKPLAVIETAPKKKAKP